MINGAPMGNIWALPWMAISPVLAGVRDYESSTSLQPITIAGGAQSLGNKRQIDGDADFLCRELQFTVTAVTGSASPSDIRARLRSGDGRMLTSDFVPIVDLNGPLAIPWPLRRGSTVEVDFLNANASNVTNQTVICVLKGWKRNACSDPSEFQQPYVPMYERYLPLREFDVDDFEYPFTFTAPGPGASFLLRQPLHTDDDADYLWCGIAGDWNTANNDVATVGGAMLTFYDVDGVPLNVQGLVNPWGALGGGIFRESVLSSGGGRPAPFWPGIWIPRAGVVEVDVFFAGAETVRFSLRGKKIYGVCK